MRLVCNTDIAFGVMSLNKHQILGVEGPWAPVLDSWILGPGPGVLGSCPGVRILGPRTSTDAQDQDEDPRDRTRTRTRGTGPGPEGQDRDQDQRGGTDHTHALEERGGGYNVQNVHDVHDVHCVYSNVILYILIIVVH